MKKMEKTAKITISEPENIIDSLLQDVQDGNPQTIGILVALFVVFLTICLLVCRKGSSKRRGILITGLCDSGKTLLFSRLTTGDFVQTHTSIKENSGTYTSESGKELSMYDLPGHERVRYTFFDQYKSSARGVIYVIDSITFQKEIKDAAEFLYNLLADALSQNSPPFLIACNKQDQALAKGAKVIQAQLEKEMNTLRVTKSAALEGTDNSTSNNNTYLGRQDKPFTFADLKPLKVTFAECSANGNREDKEPKLDDIHAWLAKLA